MDGLPLLPGLTFSDPTLNKFQVPHTLDCVYGYGIPKMPTTAIGSKQIDANATQFLQNQDPIRFDPSLTYGRAKVPSLPQYLPHFAVYDQKCLTFRAFFKQAVFESPDEHYRVRQVNIIYFLENDTITVMEPFVRNCGFKQGRLVRRGKIPKTESEYWHWKDLNVGKDFNFFGVVYHTVDCNAFTREYMASQGIIMNPTEDMPPDPYIQTRELKVATQTRVTPPLDDKLRRFLEYDGKILKFNAVWDNRAAEYGELKEYVVLYYLADDTVKVKEVHTENDGCDPCPSLLRKIKLPKNWTDRPVTYPSIYLELSDDDVTEYYQPKDFVVGETIFILGRRFLLFDCDEFTRTYFQKVLHITQGPRIEVKEKKKATFEKCMPEHGELKIGTLEDSLQNCFMAIPVRPRKNEVRLIANANKYLRYLMEMDWVHPEDSIRNFILLYNLAQGTCKIFEPPVKNSGILGGKFLRDQVIIKPGSHPYNPDFYTPADFYIGAIIHIHSHRFKIIGADLGVYRYMQANPEKFPPKVVCSMRNYMFNEGFLKDDLQDNIDANVDIARKHEIDQIGKELEVIKTEREKCLERIQESLASAAGETTAESKPETKKVKMEDTEKKHPRDKYICEYGIKPFDGVCPNPVVIADKTLEELSCPRSSGHTVKYPETEEQQLKKYYDDVLRRHEEACLKAAKYKQKVECLPGTILRDADPELSKKVLISDEERPQPHKYCVRKTVQFSEPSDKCATVKEDICLLKQPKTHCYCTEDKKQFNK